MAGQVNVGSQRKTRNSAKAAESALESTATPNIPTDQQGNVLNEGFAATPNPSFNKAMAGMQEILSSENYLNEAFSDKLSLDEKLSLIITELYRIRDTTANTEESVRILQQQVQTHDQAIKQGSLDENGGKKASDSEEMDARMATAENNIMDINTETHGIQQRISALEDKADLSNRDVALLKGLTKKHEKQLDLQERHNTQLVARSMNKNFTISGIMESTREVCVQKVFKFLTTEMEIEIEPTEIKVAHRLRFRNPDYHGTKPRLMVIKVTRNLKEKIFQNKNKLKNKLNQQGDRYFVNLQVPEAAMADKKALAYEVNRIKKFNELQIQKRIKLVLP